MRLAPVLCPLSSVYSVVPKLCLGMRPREALLRNLNPLRNLRSSPSAAKKPCRSQAPPVNNTINTPPHFPL